jgi:hypothetical protein
MEQIDYVLDKYETMDIYKHNMWQVVDATREKYSHLLKRFEISESNLVRMWKGGKCL